MAALLSPVVSHSIARSNAYEQPQSRLVLLPTQASLRLQLSVTRRGDDGIH